MSQIKELLAHFHEISSNPAKQIAAFEERTGKKAVGIFPLYVPEEIVHAAGYLPVGLWGGNKLTISGARTFLPAFACSIMQSIMELSLRGTYDNLAAVIIPSPCDTLKCMGQKWKGKCPSIQFVHPQNRILDAANHFLEAEYETVRTRLESILEEKISDEAIANSIDVYNANRRAMRRFTEVAAKHPEVISPMDRHAVIKARYFMEKSEHTALVSNLLEYLDKYEQVVWLGKRVLLTGITAEPDEVLELLAKNGFSVAADDLAQESRQFRHDVPEGGTALGRLAKWWQNMSCCSTAIDTRKSRMDTLIAMARDAHVDAVILCLMKFCDPEEFDYPILQNRLREEGIPLLCIEIDQEAVSFEQMHTRIQSFAEMLG